MEDGNFSIVFSGEDVDPNLRLDEAWFDFQFVGLNKGGAVVSNGPYTEDRTVGNIYERLSKINNTGIKKGTGIKARSFLFPATCFLVWFDCLSKIITHGFLSLGKQRLVLICRSDHFFFFNVVQLYKVLTCLQNHWQDTCIACGAKPGDLV